MEMAALRMNQSLRQKITHAARFLCFLLLLGLILSFLWKVFLVKDESFKRYENYMRLPQNSVDILFLGSSHSGDSVSPPIVNENLGLVSFNNSVNGLRIEYVPYRLEQALRTQSPKLVVLDTYLFESYWNEEEKVARWAMDALPLSLSKIRTIEAFIQEDKLSYYIPFLKYHSRYRELTQEDFDFWLNPSAYADYGVGAHEVRDGWMNDLDDYFEQDLSLEEETLPLTDAQKASMDRVVEIIKRHGTQLLLITVPYKEQMGMTSVENHRANNTLRLWYEGDPSVQFLDLNEYWGEMEFSYHDLRNEGHVNPAGREKTTAFLADYIWANYDFVE